MQNDYFTNTEADAGRWEADHASEADRDVDPVTLADLAEANVPEATPRWTCRRGCWASMWTESSRARHEARCDGTDPWTVR